MNEDTNYLSRFPTELLTVGSVRNYFNVLRLGQNLKLSCDVFGFSIFWKIIVPFTG